MKHNRIDLVFCESMWKLYEIFFSLFILRLPVYNNHLFRDVKKNYSVHLFFVFSFLFFFWILRLTSFGFSTFHTGVSSYVRYDWLWLVLAAKPLFVISWFAYLFLVWLGFFCYSRALKGFSFDVIGFLF